MDAAESRPIEDLASVVDNARKHPAKISTEEYDTMVQNFKKAKKSKGIKTRSSISSKVLSESSGEAAKARSGASSKNDKVGSGAISKEEEEEEEEET